MSRRRPLVTAILTVGIVLASASSSYADSSPSPTTSTWPDPGQNAAEATSQSITSQITTVQLVRNPMVLIEVNTEKGPGLSFSLSADVLFDTGSDILSPEADAALQELADQIVDSGAKGMADVIGHTDDVGSEAANLALSQRRASSATTRLKDLLQGQGITLTAVGKGESQPLTKNTDDASRARNRRVSVVFSGAKPENVDINDIAVPPHQQAPEAVNSAIEGGSLAGSTTTFALGSDHTEYRIQLDVTKATRRGPLLYVEVQTQSQSGPSLSSYRSLFSGHLYHDDDHEILLYDYAADQVLPVVVDGTGFPLQGIISGTLEPGSTRTCWFAFPVPSDPQAELQLYVPAFGLLTIPAPA